MHRFFIYATNAVIRVVGPLAKGEGTSEAVLASEQAAADAANYSALLNPAAFLVMYLGIAAALWHAPQCRGRSLRYRGGTCQLYDQRALAVARC